MNELRVPKYCDEISGLNHSKTWSTTPNLRCWLLYGYKILDVLDGDEKWQKDRKCPLIWPEKKHHTCRQYGLVCTNICSSCKSASCLNWEQISCSDSWLGHYIPLTFIKRDIRFNTFNILFAKIFISLWKVWNITHYVLINKIPDNC